MRLAWLILAILAVSDLYSGTRSLELDAGLPTVGARYKGSAPSGPELSGTVGEQLSLECRAAYPVQWRYAGSGSAEYAARTSSGPAYSAALDISSLKEGHTGEYVCQSPEFRHLAVGYFLYVPGPALFVSPNGRNLLYSDSDSEVRIPCAVSTKEARVSLHKSVSGELEPVPDSVQKTYDPRSGFRLRVSSSNDPTGVYVCSAGHGNLYRVIEYTLSPKAASLRTNSSTCSPSPCGRNAACHLINQRPVCKCTETFLGDPYDPHSGCRKDCTNGNKDCPLQFHCNYTTGTCEDPCEHYACDPSVAECNVTNQKPTCVRRRKELPVPCGRTRNCGPGSTCDLLKSGPTCICSDGLPPPGSPGSPGGTCRAACQRDSDCPLSKACDYPTCVNTCDKFNPCGPNATCRTVRHLAKCECDLGSSGDPNSGCGKVSSCEALSCGPRASCVLLSGRPTCACQPGSYGRPPQCRPRESPGPCLSHAGCPGDRVCSEGACLNPCRGAGTCGLDAECLVRNHTVSCACPQGFEGNPRFQCTELRGTNAAFDRRCPFNLCSGSSRRPATAGNSKPRSPPVTQPQSVKYDLILSYRAMTS